MSAQLCVQTGPERVIRQSPEVQAAAPAWHIAPIAPPSVIGKHAVRPPETDLHDQSCGHELSASHARLQMDSVANETQKPTTAGRPRPNMEPHRHPWRSRQTATTSLCIARPPDTPAPTQASTQRPLRSSICPQAQPLAQSSAARTDALKLHAHRAFTRTRQARSLLRSADLATKEPFGHRPHRHTRRRTHGSSITTLNTHAVGHNRLVTTWHAQPSMFSLGGTPPVSNTQSLRGNQHRPSSALGTVRLGYALLAKLKVLASKPRGTWLLRTVAGANRRPSCRLRTQ